MTLALVAVGRNINNAVGNNKNREMVKEEAGEQKFRFFLPPVMNFVLKR